METVELLEQALSVRHAMLLLMVALRVQLRLTTTASNPQKSAAISSNRQNLMSLRLQLCLARLASIASTTNKYGS